MSDQLIVLDKITAAELFDASTGKMEALLTDLKTAALAEVMDGSTPEGRLHCTRHKNKVVAAQKAFDELKKSQTKHLKDEATRIDKMGKKANDLCEELKAAIMKPRFEWEAKEAERVKGHLDAIQYIQDLRDALPVGDKKLSLQAYEKNAERLSAIKVDKSFEEFEQQAKDQYEASAKYLEQAIASLKADIKNDERLAELEAAEAKRLKEAEEERLRLEGEERAKQKLKEEQEAEELKRQEQLRKQAWAETERVRAQAAEEAKPAVQPTLSTEDAPEWVKAAYPDDFKNTPTQPTQEEPEAEEPPHVLAPISEAAQEALAKPQNHIDPSNYTYDQSKPAMEYYKTETNRQINRDIMEALTGPKVRLPEAYAKAVVTALYYGDLPHTTTAYVQ